MTGFYLLPYYFAQTSPVYHRNRQLTRPRFETGRVQKRYAPQSSIVLTPNGLYTSRYAPYTSGRMRGFGRGGRQYGGSRGWRDDDFGGGGYRYRGARGGRMNRVESIMRRTKSVNDIYQPLSFYTGEREFTVCSRAQKLFSNFFCCRIGVNRSGRRRVNSTMAKA
jgi:hypothetical protein